MNVVLLVHRMIFVLTISNEAAMSMVPCQRKNLGTYWGRCKFASFGLGTDLCLQEQSTPSLEASMSPPMTYSTNDKYSVGGALERQKAVTSRASLQRGPKDDG